MAPELERGNLDPLVVLILAMVEGIIRALLPIKEGGRIVFAVEVLDLNLDLPALAIVWSGPDEGSFQGPTFDGAITRSRAKEIQQELDKVITLSLSKVQAMLEDLPKLELKTLLTISTQEDLKNVEGIM